MLGCKFDMSIRGISGDVTLGLPTSNWHLKPQDSGGGCGGGNPVLSFAFWPVRTASFYLALASAGLLHTMVEGG